MFFFIDFKKDEVLRSTVCILILCMYNVTPSIVDFENSFCGQDGHQDPNGNVKILQARTMFLVYSLKLLQLYIDSDII